MNKELKQKSFAEKQEILSKTNYQINQNIGDYPDWDSGSVESRQKRMAELAKDLWKIE